jgi:hypothetical protein
MYRDLIQSSAFIVILIALVVGILVVSLASNVTWAAGDPTLGMKITSGSTCTSNCIIIGRPGPQGPPGPRGP